jgi:hypothetical protein
MTEAEFWDHIRASRRRDPDAHAERLAARLANLPPENIVDFQAWWDRMLSEAYQRDLWAAAYYANGGCSDDGFDYFRAWLVLQGRETFEAVVADANNLADYVADGEADCEFMCECSPAWSAWDLAFPAQTADERDAAFNALYHKRHPNPLPTRELGERWDFDDAEQIKRRLPRFAGDE